MNVVFTATADACLLDIYLYHRDYSRQYAVDFQNTIAQYLTTRLADNPKLGRVFNRDQGIHRLVYQQKYNVYYVIQTDVIFVIYVFDGQMDVNQQIERGEISLPDVPKDRHWPSTAAAHHSLMVPTLKSSPRVPVFLRWRSLVRQRWCRTRASA